MSAALTRATMIRVGELTGASDARVWRSRARRHVPGPCPDDSSWARRRASIGGGRRDPARNVYVVRPRGSPCRGRRRAGFGRAPPAPPRLCRWRRSRLYVKGLVAATPAAEQRFLESAMRIAPTDPRIQLELWNVYQRRRCTTARSRRPTPCPRDSPLFRRARFAVAQSLIALKRFDGAIHELEALHKTEPSAAVSNAIGIGQLRRGSTEGGSPAAAYFARAVKENPSNTTYHFNLGYAHALSGNNADALASLRETVRLDPTDGDAHLVMSAVLGRTPEGQRELELARSLGTSVDPRRTASQADAVPPALERVELDLGVCPPLAGVESMPVQRDQQETAAFHLARARPLIDQRRDTRGDRSAAARHLPVAVRRRAPPAPGHALPPRRTAAGGDRRLQDRASGLAKRPRRTSRSAARCSSPATPRAPGGRPSARSCSHPRQRRRESC